MRGALSRIPRASGADGPSDGAVCNGPGAEPWRRVALGR